MPRSGDHPFSRLSTGSSEPSGGLSFSGQGVFVRVDAPPPSHGHDKAGFSPPSDRPFRVESELLIAAILLPFTGSSSLESGRFSCHWSGIRGFAFPPIALIPRILHKIREDRAIFLLVAPRWPRRPWFLELVSLLLAPPRLLLIRPDVIRQPISFKRHENPTSLHLSVWPLSGRSPET